MPSQSLSSMKLRPDIQLASLPTAVPHYFHLSLACRLYYVPSQSVSGIKLRVLGVGALICGGEAAAAAAAAQNAVGPPAYHAAARRAESWASS